MDPLSSALSGIRTAEIRFAASAHNVANLTTPSFRPLRVHQGSLEQGGARAMLERASDPREVDIAHEFIEQARTALQFNASLRAFEAHEQTRGRLLDLLA